MSRTDASRSLPPDGGAPPRRRRLLLALPPLGLLLLLWLGLDDRANAPARPGPAPPAGALGARAPVAPLAADPAEQPPVAEIRVIDAASAEAIPPARVEVTVTSDGERLAVSATPAAFEVAGVDEGSTYRVEVRTPGAEYIPYRGTHAGRELFPLDVELDPAALPTCELLDGAGAPIGGARVWVGVPDALLPTLPPDFRHAVAADRESAALTDREGRADLGPLPPGDGYWVHAEAEGFARGGVDDLHLPAGRSLVPFRLTRECVVRYSVLPGGALRHTLVSVEDPVVRGDGGTFVPAHPEPAPRAIADGAHESRGLAPGLKAIQVVREIPPGAIEVTRASARLREGEIRDLGRIDPSATQCTIRVLGPEGEPAAGVEIRGGYESGDVTFDLATFGARTDGSGELVIRGLPPRRIGFQVIPTRETEWLSTQVWIDLAREDLAVVDLARRPERIELAWTIPSNPAAEEALIAWLAIGSDGRRIRASILPSRETFRVRARPGVRARVFVRSDDGWVGSSSWFDFAGPSGGEREIRLGRGKSVRGIVPAEALARLGPEGDVGMYEASTVEVEGREAIPIGLVPIGPGGKYRFEGVPTGERLVFAARSGLHFEILDSPEE